MPEDEGEGEELPLSSPVVVPGELSCDLRSSFLSGFFESSCSACGFAFPCGVLTGTERGVAAIVLAEVR